MRLPAACSCGWLMNAAPHPLRERTIALLADLVSFPSVSLKPNDGIVSFIESWLGDHGITCWRDAHEDGQRFNLLARIGPQEGPGAEGGILLCFRATARYEKMCVCLPCYLLCRFPNAEADQ